VERVLRTQVVRVGHPSPVPSRSPNRADAFRFLMAFSWPAERRRAAVRLGWPCEETFLDLPPATPNGVARAG